MLDFEKFDLKLENRFNSLLSRNQLIYFYKKYIDLCKIKRNISVGSKRHSIQINSANSVKIKYLVDKSMN